MENIDDPSSKLTAFGVIDKVKSLVDAFALVREQAEAYAKNLVDLDTDILEGIRDRLNAVNETYLTKLRDARSKIAEVERATQEYVMTLEILVREILSTPNYRQQLKVEVEKVRENEVEDNPPSLLPKYRRILESRLGQTENALAIFNDVQTEAQKVLDHISGIIRELKDDLKKEKCRCNDEAFVTTVGAASALVACAGAFIVTGLAIASAPGAAVVAAGLGIAGADLSAVAIVSAAGTVGAALLSNDLWKRPYSYHQKTKNCAKALDHVENMEFVLDNEQGKLSQLADSIQASKASTVRIRQHIGCLKTELDCKDYDSEGHVLPTLQSLWDAAEKHNIPGKDDPAE